jgi:hypothetical protein
MIVALLVAALLTTVCYSAWDSRQAGMSWPVAIGSAALLAIVVTMFAAMVVALLVGAWAIGTTLVGGM